MSERLGHRQATLPCHHHQIRRTGGSDQHTVGCSGGMRRGGFGCFAVKGNAGADWMLSDELCGAGESPLPCTNDSVLPASSADCCRPSSSNGSEGPLVTGAVVLCSVALLRADKSESISSLAEALLRRRVLVSFVFKGVPGVADLTFSVEVGALAWSLFFSRLLVALV